MTTELDTDEAGFIELAKGPRRVATVEGSQFYGLPIGSVITKDVRDAIHAAKALEGLTPPKGALKEGSGNHGSSFAAAKAAASVKPAVPAAPKLEKLKVGKSSISGPEKFKIGNTSFSAPKGSKLIHPADAPDMSYILTPDGTVHAFVEKGEITIPAGPLEGKLIQKFSGDLTHDPHYVEEPFSNTAASYGISNLKSGDTLTDPEGNPQFVKQDDGTFKHSLLGSTLEEKDLSDLYDSGELVPQKDSKHDTNEAAFENSDAKDFKSMSAQDAKAALDGMAEGAQVSIDSPGQNPALLTKNADGSWNDQAGLKIESQNLAYLRSNMTVAGTKDKPAPTPVEDTPTPDVPNPDEPKKQTDQELKDQFKNNAKDLPKKIQDSPKETPKQTDQELKDQFKDNANVLPKKIQDQSTPKTPEPKADPLPDGIPEGSVPVDSLKAMDDAPTGSVLMDKQNGLEFTKKSSGQWYESKSNILWNSGDIFNDEYKGPQFLNAKGSGMGSSKQDEAPKPTTKLPKNVSVVTSMDDVSDSSVLIYDDGTTQHTLTNKGMYWDSGDSAAQFYNSEIAQEISNGHIYMEPKAQVEPAAPVKTYKVGEALENHQDLQDAPSGIEFSYTSLGGEKKNYVKTSQGLILAPSGVAYPMSNFKSSANSKSLVIESLPDEAPAAPEAPNVSTVADPNGYHSGDKITMLGHLTDMPEGSKISAGTGQHKVVLTKNANGSWEDENKYEISFASIGSDIKHGNIHFESSPEAAYPTSDTPEVTFEPGGQAYSTKDLKEALDALEAHPSSQVAYGLKAVKDGPLGETNNKADQTHIVSLAQDKFPDLKPKPALIALLKQKLGMSTVDKEKKTTAVVDAPKIHFGDAEPKKSNFGLSGGDFTHEEIQNAIDTMEKFQGKNYLADLKNKGNPIGYLNDNALVGADKDKTVKKQKMIDLLKEKLGDSQSLQALKDKLSEAPGGDTNPPGELADWELELLSPSKPDHTIGSPLDQSKVDGYDVGTQISTSGSTLYTKQEDGSWLSDSGTTFDSETIAGTVLNFKVVGTKDEPYVPLTPPAPSTPIDEYPPAPLEEKAPAVPEDIPNVPQYAVGQTVTPIDMDALPSGTNVKITSGLVYTKNAEGKWKAPGVKAGYPSTDFQNVDTVIHFLPEDYNKTKTLTKEDVPGLGIGSVIAMHIPSNGVGAPIDYTLTKSGPDQWTSSLSPDFPLDDYAVQATVAVHGKGGIEALLKSTPTDVPSYSLATPAVASKNSPSVDDAPVLDENSTNLTPGKYSTATGKAYMIVKADGTGVYVSASGTVSALTPGKVTANHKAGLTTYHGIPDSIPELTPADAAIAKGKAKIPKAKGAEVNLPDGVYYLGNPKGEATKVYEVKDGQVKIHEDDWTHQNMGHKAEFVPLSKIKTNFLNGKVLDTQGTSVVPDGYEGPLFVKNTPTTTHSLVEVKKLLNSGKLDNFWQTGTQNLLHSYGFSPSIYKVQNDIKVDNPDIGYKPYDLVYTDAPEAPWNVAAKNAVEGWIDPLLNNISYEAPEGNPAAEFFDWSSDGTANKTASIVAAYPDYNYNTEQANAFVKAVQEQFGGKGVIAPVAFANQYDKANWIEAFKKGNFKEMYAYEVQAAVSKDKVHPEGYKHPGFPSNESTHQVSWAAAVPGEAPATKPVEGTWSDMHPSKWSLDEINNYIVAAHMQNPQYLSNSEKRDWVYYHKQAQSQDYVDKMSLTALNRKNDGVAPLSDEPVWNDEIKPSKSYDSYFDDTDFPTAETWTNGGYGESSEWYKDNWEDPEVQAAALEAYNEYNGSSDVASDVNFDPEVGFHSSYVKQKAVANYWGKKRAEYEAELAKPIYEVTKKIDAGSHPVYLMKDQHGRQYVFKPTADSGKEWRTEQEHASSLLGKKFGYNTPGTKVHSMEEKYYKENGSYGLVGQHGLLMDFAPNKGSLQLNDSDIIGLKMTDLTPKQAGQVGAEHVLDWILDNDDTHGENMLIGNDGNLVGIDKGRGLFIYGNWDGLEAKSQQAGVGANSNMMHGPTVYNLMYGKITSGALSKEHADAAYFAAMKAAKRIQKFSDAEVEKILREGAKNRTSWKKPHYMTSKEPAPTNVDELVAAFLERKSILTDEIQEMWNGIYKDAGYDLPEIPAKALPDEHISGWEEGNASSSALEAKVWGAAPLHASAGISSGSSLLWSEKGSEGEDLILGKFQVGALTQKKILNVLKPKSGDNTGVPTASIQSFPNTATIKHTITAAAKDASQNAVDKSYTPELQAALDTTDFKLQSDLDYWGTDLTGQDDGLIEFPSGMKVSEDGLLQYKQMLDHYSTQVAKVKAAKENSETTNKSDFSIFQPVALAPTPNVYVKTNDDGSQEKYTELSTGYYLKQDASGVSQTLLPEEVQQKEDGWSLQDAPSDNLPQQGTAVYSKLKAQGLAGALGENGVKTQSEGNSAGHKGDEYSIELATGEKIYFRNSSETNTSASQRGTVTFKLAAGDDQDASLARVKAELETMGLNMDGASEEDAESVYWRNMFSRVMLSNDSGADSKIQAAREKISAKRDEIVKALGLSTYEVDHRRDLIEGIGLTMSPEEEHTFWNDLAKETYGADKVTEWINGGFHLPNYHHLDLTDTEKATGLPYWNRIDVDVKKLKEKNTLLAIGNNGKDTSLLNYIKSGGMISTEERLRILGFYKDGASSTEDQNTGGATSVFTRIAVPGKGVEHTGNIYGKHVAYWNPSVLAETGTYSYSGDNYGNIDQMASSNPYDPMHSLAEHTGGGNETMVQNTLSIFDHLEIMVFEDAMKRDEAIQKMKALGFETLRGLPIEERMVMRDKLDAAMQKVKAAWAEEGTA